MILDTSVLVEIDRGHAEKEKIQRLERAGNLGISSVTVTEFMAGAYLTGTEKKKLKEILSRFEQIGVDGLVAEHAASLWALNIKEDLGIPTNDIYIAATAVARDEELLTCDIDDFDKIEGLKLKDWKNF